MQQEQSDNVDAPAALERAASVTVVSEELAVHSDKATVAQPTVDAKDAAPAITDAGIKRSSDAADDTSVSKAAKVDE